MGRNRRRGTSLLEITISTAILAFLVFAAAQASRVAISTADDVTERDATTGDERRTSDRLEEFLLSASLGTLEGLPAQQGVAVEPMQDDVDYQELQFRRVVGFEKGEIAYEPPTGASAARLYRSVDKAGDGTLVLEERGNSSLLLSDVTAVVFRKSGSKLTVEISTGRGDDAPAERVTELVLRVP
jgi:hypothetical protein